LFFTIFLDFSKILSKRWVKNWVTTIFIKVLIRSLHTHTHIHTQKAKILFDKLGVVGQPISLEDFNLFMFWDLRGEFKDLVKSFATKA